MSRSKLLVMKNFRIKINNIPNSNGSVGKNMSKASPCVNSESGNESGVQKTTRYKSLSKAKIAIKIIPKISGKALIIIECFLAIK